MQRLKKINLNEIKLLALSFSTIAVLFQTAVEFNFITTNKYKVPIFIVLGITLILNLSIEIKEKLSEKSKEAKKVLIQALDICNITLGQGRNEAIRSCVFLRSKKDLNKIKIGFHSSIMEKAIDSDIEFEKWQGVVGNSWGYDAPTLASLNNFSEDKLKEWSITQKQYTLTKNLKTIFTYPITNPLDNTQTIGILSFDSDQDMYDYFEKESTNLLIANLACFIGKLLVVYNYKRVLNDHNNLY